MELIQNLITRFKQGLYLSKKYIRIKGLPFSFAHISDLHFSEDGKLPLWVMHGVKNYLFNNPTEILCVTGDIIDRDEECVAEALKWINSLPVNYVVLSLGNHDLKAQDLIFQTAAIYPKIKIFINGSFIYGDVNFICAADKGDSKYYPQSLKKIPGLYNRTKLNFVLSHNPNSFIDFCEVGLMNSYVLSGHTHGGQVAFADFLSSVCKRFIGKHKMLCALKINHEHDCFKLQGEYVKCTNTLFINNGLGTHPPGRIFCPPTITIFK